MSRHKRITRTIPYKENQTVSMSERQRELRARRKRRKTIAKMKASLPTADAAKKAVYAEKLRKMTPGAEELIQSWGLE